MNPATVISHRTSTSQLLVDYTADLEAELRGSGSETYRAGVRAELDALRAAGDNIRFVYGVPTPCVVVP